MTDIIENQVETTHCGAESVADVLNKARSAFVGARDSVIHAASVERARGRIRAIDDYVHKSPWSLIGGVAVLALAVGFLLRRR